MEVQIKEIFKTRDNAIAEHNQRLFLSTQIGEISKSGSKGYIKIDRLISKVLHIHHDAKDTSLWLALIQEDYFLNRTFSHRNYLLYKLIEKDKRLLITDIIY